MRHRVIISGDITTESFGKFLEEIRDLTFQASDTLEIAICSEGGYAPAALAYYDAIQAVNCRVKTIGVGIVASAAALIFMAGDERYMSPSAWFMVHDETAEDTTNLRHSQAKKLVKQQGRFESQWNELMHKCCPAVSVDEWDEYHREEVYFTAQECLSNGFINGIIGENDEK